MSTFRNTPFHLCRWCKWRCDSVPKRRHIKFKCRGNHPKKEYNIPNRLKLEINSRILCNPTPNLNQHTHSARHHYQKSYFNLNIPRNTAWHCDKVHKIFMLHIHLFFNSYTFLLYRIRSGNQGSTNLQPCWTEMILYPELTHVTKHRPNNHIRRGTTSRFITD